MVIFLASLYKLEPKKCFSVVAYNFDFDKGTLVTGIIAEGEVLNNDEIKWTNK